jgi:hypothetical protein
VPVIVQPPTSGNVGQPVTSGSVRELPGPGIPKPFQLLDISLWQYGLVLVVLVIGGLAAWVLHLRGARW